MILFLESVWILLILLKHCNKIIFKCVNSAIRPFLMKVLMKKEVCESRKQYTDLLTNNISRENTILNN